MYPEHTPFPYFQDNCSSEFEIYRFHKWSIISLYFITSKYFLNIIWFENMHFNFIEAV